MWWVSGRQLRWLCCVGCRVAPCFDSYCFGVAMDWRHARYGLTDGYAVWRFRGLAGNGSSLLQWLMAWRMECHSIHHSGSGGSFLPGGMGGRSASASKMRRGKEDAWRGDVIRWVVVGEVNLSYTYTYWQNDRKRQPQNQKGKAKAKLRLFVGSSYSLVTHFT